MGTSHRRRCSGCCSVVRAPHLWSWNWPFPPFAICGPFLRARCSVCGRSLGIMVPIGSLLIGGYIAGRMRAPREGADEAETEFRDGLHGGLVWVSVSSLAQFFRSMRQVLLHRQVFPIRARSTPLQRLRCLHLPQSPTRHLPLLPPHRLPQDLRPLLHPRLPQRVPRKAWVLSV